MSCTVVDGRLLCHWAWRREFDCTYPKQLLGWVLSCREGQTHRSRSGKARKLELVGGPWACNKAGAIGSSDSHPSRCGWESQKSREWSRGLGTLSSLGRGTRGAPACPMSDCLILAAAGLVAVVAGSTRGLLQTRLQFCTQMPSSWLPTAGLMKRESVVPNSLLSWWKMDV